jgi:hypothetical protein
MILPLLLVVFVAYFAFKRKPKRRYWLTQPTRHADVQIYTGGRPEELVDGVLRWPCGCVGLPPNRQGRRELMVCAAHEVIVEVKQ